MLTRSRIMLIIWTSLALSLGACIVYVITINIIPLYLAWGLLVPVLVCFFLLNTIMRLRHPTVRRIRVHHRYYGYVESGTLSAPE